MSIVGHHIKHV